MCLAVIGGEICSKMEMVFRFRSRDWSFLQNNVYCHRQTIELSVFWSLEGIFKTLQQALLDLQSSKRVVLLVEM